MPPASTSAGIGTDEDEIRTKAALQRWLNAGPPHGNALMNETNAQLVFRVLEEAERANYRKGELETLWERMYREALAPNG